MTFYDCLLACAGMPEFVQGFNRLTGCHLGEKLARSPFDAMIDKATGYDEVLAAQQDGELQQFVEFCHEFVWLRRPQWGAHQ